MKLNRYYRPKTYLFFRDCYEYILSTLLYFWVNFCIFNGFLENWVKALSLTAVLYVMIFFTVYNDIHIGLVALLAGARPLMTNREKDYLLPIFNRMKSKFQCPDVELYIANDFSVNAFTVGRNGICITKGAVNGLSRGQLQGIIAHEFGHIYAGHTIGAMIGLYGGGIFSFLAMLFKLCLRKVNSRNEEEIRMSGHYQKPNLLVWLISTYLKILIYSFELYKNIAGAFRNRKREYSADVIAYHHGYEDELISALYMLDDIYSDGFVNMQHHLIRSHPYLYERIEMLEMYCMRR